MVEIFGTVVCMYVCTYVNDYSQCCPSIYPLKLTQVDCTVHKDTCSQYEVSIACATEVEVCSLSRLPSLLLTGARIPHPYSLCRWRENSRVQESKGPGLSCQFPEGLPVKRWFTDAFPGSTTAEGTPVTFLVVILC